VDQGQHEKSLQEILSNKVVFHLNGQRSIRIAQAHDIFSML
jgi:hypothetical protein